MVKDGRYPVLIGKAEHVEVKGLVGDLDAYLIIEGERDLDKVESLLAENPQLRLGVASQTTQPVEVVEAIVKQMRARFPEVDLRYYDTVCQPTKDRQVALRKLVTESDVVVVVGGPDSNNSRKLTELARQLGRPAYQVACTAELRPEWFAEHQIVGLTAGTSTPDPVIAEIRSWLEALPVN
jgi:4-hydroxy-3-methylbut-2-enyl diphosphate reductase